MKFNRAPQFDLPGQESAFNLCGELLKQAPPVKQPDTKPDLTMDLFKPMPAKCGKQCFGFMPPCVLERGHVGSCEDGFGGYYNHPDTINPEPRKDKTE